MAGVWVEFLGELAREGFLGDSDFFSSSVWL
jgi:hypothetical protein